MTKPNALPGLLLNSDERYKGNEDYPQTLSDLRAVEADLRDVEADLRTSMSPYTYIQYVYMYMQVNPEISNLLVNPRRRLRAS